MDIKNQTNFIVRTELVNAYLHDISKFKPLSAEEEKNLFLKLEESKARVAALKAEIKEVENEMDMTDDEFTSDYYTMVRNENNIAIKREEKIQSDIRTEVINRYQRFVFAFAKRYDVETIIMDLVNVGNIGLMEAFDEYDVNTGNRFSTLAQNYVRRAIKGYLDTENLTVRSTNNARILPKVKKITNDFFSKEGRNPTDIEIQELLKEKYNIELKDSSDIYGARMEYIDASIDDNEDNVFENSIEFSEKTASGNTAEDILESDDQAKAVAEVFKSVDEREAKILKMSFGIAPYSKEYTNKEIAEELGITAERVRQLLKGAIAKAQKGSAAI